MRAKLNLYGPFALQLVASLLIGIVALMSERLWAIVNLLVALAGMSIASLLLGQRLALASFKQAMAWVPTSIHVVENDDGGKIAIVEQQSGAIVSLELPDEIESPYELSDFVIEQLRPK